MSIQSSFLLSITLLVCCLACKDTNSGQSSKIEKDHSNSATSDAKNEAGANAVKIYAWVDKLRVREAPDTKSKIITELKQGDSLTYLQEQSDFTQKITLRGKSFDEPWLKVRTGQDQTGWVYGGGVKFYKTKAAPTLTRYDECFKFLKEYRHLKFQSCFEEKQAIQFQRTRRIVESKPEGLSLRLLTGKKVFLQNSSDEDNYLQHCFYYYYPKMSSFVVEVIYEDGAEFLLLNDKSGVVTKIWGYPKPSPDNQQWVVSSVDSGEGLRQNGIQILAITNDGLKVVWEEEMTQEPYLPFWLDEDTIEVSVKRRGSSKTAVKTLVRGADGGWGVGVMASSEPFLNAIFQHSVSLKEIFSHKMRKIS